MKVKSILEWGLVVVIVFNSSGSWTSNAQAETAVPFKWENWEETDRTFLEEQRTTLEKGGGKVGQVEETHPGVRNPAVVWLVLAGTAAVTVLAETVVKAVKELNQCGVVVDAKGEELNIRRNCDLDGNILIRRADGTIDLVKKEQPDSLAIAVLKTVLEGFMSKLDK
ncbi:hypothetical protein ACTRXD_07345 [Nitrospira sp. T9]|uniref:hypothetical protein n=1 Tax=unclassified Nitrospira TaxID=2652172 RepID=UPI003F95F497